MGEFDQKWRREVKWGSREELEGLIEAAKGGGEGRKEDGGEVEIVWDAVLSHKTAGDDVEETWAVEVDPNGTSIFEYDLLFDFLDRLSLYTIPSLVSISTASQITSSSQPPPPLSNTDADATQIVTARSPPQKSFEHG